MPTVADVLRVVPPAALREAPLGVMSMCGRLRAALLVTPDAAGWGPEANWREIGYRGPPDRESALRQHREIEKALADAGVTLRRIGPEGSSSDGFSSDGFSSARLTPDAAYCHDASFPSPRGMILMRMGKPTRRGEPELHRAAFAEAGIPVVGEIAAPAVAEAGDLVWLDEGTVLAGEGYRTDAAGIRQLEALVAPDGVEVVPAPLPHGGGPGECLHLMSLLSVLDSRTILADPERLAVSTLKFLAARGFEWIPIVPEERDAMAANVLSLGEGELLAIAANRRTNERLRDAGYRVRVYEGSEISGNGAGGPTCLTRPVVRDPPGGDPPASGRPGRGAGRRA